MAAVNGDLKRTVSRTRRTALLLIDFMNPLDFVGAKALAQRAVAAARHAAALKARLSAARVPVIYANDNFGRWRSDLKAVVRRCLEPGCKGRPLPGSAEIRLAAYDIAGGRLREGIDGFAVECRPGEVGMLLTRLRSAAS